MLEIFPTGLAFLFSYKCNFKCRHCSINADPSHKEVIDIDTVKKAIKEASDIASIQVLVATGGEPTLFPRHLETFLMMAHDFGFTTRVVTNVWWAKSLELADRFLSRWKKLGLDELNISFDDFHLEYLRRFGGLNNIKNAVKVAIDNEIKVVIAIVRSVGTSLNAAKVRLLLGDLANYVYTTEDFFAPVGRAGAMADHAVVNLPKHGGCAEAGSSLSLHPNGDIAYCCGHIINDSDSSWFTRVGNIHHEHLWDIVERIRKNLLVIAIRVVGPHQIVKYFNSHERVYHMCHACHLLATKYWEDLVRLGKAGLLKVVNGVLDNAD